ncbi:MAG: 3-phosphoshikimate 1-carboxyvinyltransferase, partial [Proteobacteria bacterium]|nr:3-phosphoshikimate 1-carboxyvinyltransferase [Pseudomonadota bacterium]
MSATKNEASAAGPGQAMTLQGRFTPPGDKSISHRLALLSVLAGGEARIRGFSPGRDCARSLDAVRRLGVTAMGGPDRMVLRGAGGRIDSWAFIDCGNSGTTMRLLMGVLAGRPGWYILDGDASLRRRPMERVAGPLLAMGSSVECCDGRPPVRIVGNRLTGGTHRLPVASAQVKSALLLAGVQASRVTRVIEPGPSRDHTERLLAKCGARIRPENGAWVIEPSELTLPDEFWVPGDISSAAFLLCGAALAPGGDVTAEKVLLNPTRLGWLEVLRRMRARVEVEVLGDDPEPWGNVRVRHTPDLQACQVRAEEIPLLVDEVPILALVATQCRGTTVFRGVGELRVKESDRLAAVAGELGKMGAGLRVSGDDLLID